MHWLLSLDIALFHFINGTMSNPFFDWLMPVLSGRGVPWLIAVIIAVPCVIFFGSARLRICSLLMLLVVALGDPLVIGTIRKAIGRARPCMGLNDVIDRLGCTGSGSMPSAHAANTFAVAMIAFLFYRRSGWILFPLAAGVAFSRVYCGVHYPSDVTVGAILGAGYAIAFVMLIQSLWSFVGRRIFPGWQAQLPYLLYPEKGSEAPPSPVVSNAQWLRLGYLVIAAALVGRWIYIGSGIINLSEGEAYQWLWSKHLALSYYSSPPGAAYIQWIGTALFGDRELGVRFFSPVFAAILSAVVLRFMARGIGGRAAFALLLATFAVPLLAAGSVLMTADPPLVLCWMWAVVAGWRAVQPNSTTRDWLVVGLAMGLGFLCQYTAMLQIICWAIFFIAQPAARKQLGKAGPWLALGIFLVCTLPVLIWNARHGWITGDAGLSPDATHPGPGQQIASSLGNFSKFTLVEFGLLNPVFFIAALWAMFAAWPRRRERPLWWFLFCMSAPLFIGYWLYSFHARVQPNWSAAAVPPMFCLMGLYWHESKWRVKPFYATGLLIGIVTVVFMYDFGLVGRLTKHKLPGDKDPTHCVFGWRETAQAVEAERAKFDTNAFIIADRYGTTGLYTFYSPRARVAATGPTPLVYGVESEDINQFPLGDKYNYREHRRGENAIFVIRLDPYPLEAGWFGKWLRRESISAIVPPPTAIPQPVADEFESTTNLGIREIVLRDGRVFQRVQIFGCYHLK